VQIWVGICALLVQIGEEIAAALPHVIGPDYRLRQIWAYKNGHHQPRTAPHADFAAVNVNIWLTPDSANLDPTSGGLDVYDVEAPPIWNFDRIQRLPRPWIFNLIHEPAVLKIWLDAPPW